MRPCLAFDPLDPAAYAAFLTSVAAPQDQRVDALDTSLDRPKAVRATRWNPSLLRMTQRPNTRRTKPITTRRRSLADTGSARTPAQFPRLSYQPRTAPPPRRALPGHRATSSRCPFFSLPSSITILLEAAHEPAYVRVRSHTTTSSTAGSHRFNRRGSQGPHASP